MSTQPSRLRAQTRSPSHPDNPVLMSHQSFIRSLPCLGCGKPAPAECAHVGMLAGLAIPTSDRYLVPLCGPPMVWLDCCHSRKHYLGAVRFWSELGIDPLGLASQLWRVSGDLTAGLRALKRARQAAARQLPKSQRWEGEATALRHRLPPAAMVTPPMSSELLLPTESRL
jgi:hypothetical protein